MKWYNTLLLVGNSFSSFEGSWKMILKNNESVDNWGPHGRRILQLLATEGEASRERLHELSGLHRNLIGDAVRRLLDDGLVRMEEPAAQGRGRPQTPMVLDPTRRCVLGVAIDPKSISACPVNLLGQPVGAPTVCAVSRNSDRVQAAAKLISAKTTRARLAISVTITGIIDFENNLILESSAVKGKAKSLDPIHQSAGDSPLIVENDLHALAQYWRMTRNVPLNEDVLLIRLEVGAVGAALIIRGQPHVGCIHAASEIGHTRLPVETEECYCGNTGCLERIFDSDFARSLDGSQISLGQRIKSPTQDKALSRIIELVGLGIANAIQLIKPHRVLLASQYSRYANFKTPLVSSIRSQLLASLRNRISIDWWDLPSTDRSIIAAFPALNLFLSEQPITDYNSC